MSAELMLEASRLPDGRASVVASLGDRVVARDTVDLRSADDRRRCAEAIREAAPALTVESIESELLAIDPEKLPPAARGSDDAGPIRPRLLCMADVEPRPIRWLWQNRIPLGRLSLLVGMPGCGKSYLSCDMAARVSTGTPWPDGSPCDRGSVLFITAEDDPHDTIRPRLDAHRADVSRVHLLAGSVVREPDGQESEMMFSLQDVATLEAAVEAVPDCRLIVVDPIGSFLGGRTDAHRDNEVRGVLAPVAMAAERSGAAVLIVAHRRKSAGGSADDMALGSRAFTGLARAVWHLSRDPDDAPRRLWLPGKNNLAAEPDGLAFRILGDPASVHWEPEALSMSADDALSRERAGDDGERSAGDEAVAWLEQYLDECGRPAKEIKADARKDGIAARTLDRAAAKLGVVKEPGGFGGPWHWRIPSADPDSLAKSCQSRQGENPGETADTMARLDGGPDGSAAPAPSVEPDPADPPVRRSGVI